MKTPETIIDFKYKALNWANQFGVCCFLDSNEYQDKYAAFDFLLAVDVQTELKSSRGNSFDQLKTFCDKHKQWIFGYLGYDLKNQIEDLSSKNRDQLKFDDLYFFIPKYLIAYKNGIAEVLIGDASLLNEIDDFIPESNLPSKKPTIKSRLSETQYIEKIELLKEHIARGDIYEINFCQEFFAEHAEINPLEIFESLNRLSPTPFAGFFKINQRYILSATPERFLCKRGDKLISQPIKGTAKRSLDAEEDEAIKSALRNDIKEQAENVMIVDLVRHDLTKSAIKGSVKVEELFGIYTFPQVHQMISTIGCHLHPDVHFIEAIKNAFPMGSMTGAPKVKAMQLIEQYEETKRGVFSGSFGCINPNGDFDFNVVIRTILYDGEAKYLSFQVGSAITYQSNANAEYEECMLKATAILKVLGAQ
ncbi:aminodeoxychorismate synthase component I [Pedobacter yonginense]|uniref:Aminodeoxychorismate synthase component I n=1 Tax=Pedobacter yonginense TaxID=651869 RepID=A0A317EGV8_9SPHI|nr:anthranilate synthase component I family protein [Pedobacter yonginense]PWS26050.1 aminodeoxychorismate synthase component I [Pedobacter yonginense]